MGIHRKRFCAGVSGLVVTWAMASVAAAAPQPPASDSSVSEIVVTGTNIRGAAPVGSPVVSVDREQIETSGAVTTTQMLQQIPQVYNLGVSETSRGQSGGSSNISYGSAVNIRGIGPYATLTLVDGQRVVPQGGGGQGVDPSIIPTIMLQRVDVLADGASAVYGSDAIAGVANLILRRNYTGMDATARFGKGNSYDEHQLGFITGKKWNGGQFTIGYENGYHSSLNGAARSFFQANQTALGGGDYRGTNCNPGTVTIAGVTYPIPAAGATAGTLVAGAATKCDNFKTADLLPRITHDSIAATVDQDFTDKIHLRSDIILATRAFRLQPAPATASLTITSASPSFVLPTGVVGPTSESVAYSFTGWPRDFQRGYTRTVNVGVGADYKLPHDFKLSVDYGIGATTDRSLSDHGINTTAVNAAILAGTFNPLNPASNPNTIVNGNDAIFDSSTRNDFQSYGLKIDGALFNLPGGPLKIAGGYQGQRFVTKLGAFQAVPVTPNVYTLTVRRFVRNVSSFYAEALAPIVGKDSGIPLVQGLDFDVAGRYDRYDDINAHTTNPKYGVNWTVMDGLVLKASYGTSFRAPILPQIYGNSNGLFIQNYQDPTCSCTIVGIARSGGNLNLKPETATTKTFTLDFRPKAIPGLSVNVSYFDVTYENQVLAVLSNLTILGSEAQYAGTGIITRNPTLAFLTGLNLPVLRGGPLNPAALPLVYVDGRSQNLGVSMTKGFDFLVNYKIPTSNFGDYTVGVNGTYFTDYKVAVTPIAPLTDQLNNIFNPLRFRARVNASWAKGPVGAWVFVNYQNAYTNTVPTVHQTVSNNTTFDARLAYTLKGDAWFDKGVTLSVDAINLFNKAPPYVNIAQGANGGGGFDPTASNPVGRILSVGLDKKW